MLWILLKGIAADTAGPALRYGNGNGTIRMVLTPQPPVLPIEGSSYLSE